MTTLPWTRHCPSTRLHYKHNTIHPHVSTMTTALSIHTSSLWPHSNEHSTICRQVPSLLQNSHQKTTVYQQFFTESKSPVALDLPNSPDLCSRLSCSQFWMLVEKGVYLSLKELYNNFFKIRYGMMGKMDTPFKPLCSCRMGIFPRRQFLIQFICCIPSLKHQLKKFLNKTQMTSWDILTWKKLLPLTSTSLLFLKSRCPNP